MGKNIKIGNEPNGYITISVTGRTYPDNTDFWDGNWLNTEVTVYSRKFRGRANPNLRTEEFRLFLENIKSVGGSIDNTAKFSTMQEYFEITISNDKKVGLIASGTLIDSHVLGNKLSFTVRLNEKELTEIATQVNSVLKEFPVVGE